MTVELERLPPKTRQRVEELMRANGWSFSRAINEITETAIASGAFYPGRQEEGAGPSVGYPNEGLRQGLSG